MLKRAMLLLIVFVAVAAATRGAEARLSSPARFDECRLYGYARGTADYRLCRMNVRRHFPPIAWGRLATPQPAC